MEEKSFKLKPNLQISPKMGKVKSKKCAEEIKKDLAKSKESGVDPAQIPLPDDEDNDGEIESRKTEKNTWIYNFVGSAQKMLHDIKKSPLKVKEEFKLSPPLKVEQKFPSLKMPHPQWNEIDKENPKLTLKPITMTKSHATNSWYISNNGDEKKLMKNTPPLNQTPKAKRLSEAQRCVFENSTAEEKILPNPFDHNNCAWKGDSEKIQPWQVSAILVENKKPWQCTVSWNLRNHIILKVMELFLRVFNMQAANISKPGTSEQFLPFAKSTEFKIYQMANGKLEYYEMLCQEILDFQEMTATTREILLTKLPVSLLRSNITPVWFRKLERYMDERLVLLELKLNHTCPHIQEVKNVDKKIPDMIKNPMFKGAKGQLMPKVEKKEKIEQCNPRLNKCTQKKFIKCSRCKKIAPEMFSCHSCEGFNLCDGCEKIDDHEHYMVKSVLSDYTYSPTSMGNNLETAID